VPCTALPLIIELVIIKGSAGHMVCILVLYNGGSFIIYSILQLVLHTAELVSFFDPNIVYSSVTVRNRHANNPLLFPIFKVITHFHQLFFCGGDI